MTFLSFSSPICYPKTFGENLSELFTEKAIFLLFSYNYDYELSLKFIYERTTLSYFNLLKAWILFISFDWVVSPSKGLSGFKEYYEELIFLS